MRKVIKYVAFDGAEFATQGEVKTYEAEWRAINRVKEILESTIRNGRVDAVIRHMVLEAESIQGALSEVIRINKQKKKVAVPQK